MILSKHLFLGNIFLLYNSPNIVDRTFDNPLILYNFTAIHLTPGPLNPFRIDNSFGDDPLMLIEIR